MLDLPNLACCGLISSTLVHEIVYLFNLCTIWKILYLIVDFVGLQKSLLYRSIYPAVSFLSILRVPKSNT